MEDTLKLFLDSQITWASALVIVAFFFRSVPEAMLSFAKSRTEAHAALERDRIEAEKDQTRVLNALKDELAIGRAVSTQLIAGVNAIPATLEALQRQNGIMHNDVKTVPAEVWRLGDVRLQTMRDSIETRMNTLQRAIEERLDPQAANARAAIREEFHSMATRLDDIDRTLKHFQKPKTQPIPDPVTGDIGHNKETKHDGTK